MPTFKNIFFVIIFLALSISCSKKDPTIIIFDDLTNLTYVPNFNNKKESKKIKSWKITKENFVLIDSLLISKSLMSAPETINGREPFKIKMSQRFLEGYYKQYIPYIDKNGNRIVYINAICDKHENWKTKIIIVRDGGDCYWQLKINLDKEIMYEFHTNSIA